MYIPGRFRTASRPSKILILSAEYSELTTVEEFSEDIGVNLSISVRSFFLILYPKARRLHDQPGEKDPRTLSADFERSSIYSEDFPGMGRFFRRRHEHLEVRFEEVAEEELPSPPVELR